jgi:hypothetical protein
MPQMAKIINKIYKNHIVVFCGAFLNSETLCPTHSLMINPKRAAMR